MATTLNCLGRAAGVFVYNAKWILRFYDQIQPLIKNKNFPLNVTVIQAFKTEETTREYYAAKI